MPEHLTIDALLHHHTAHTPDKPMVVDPEKRLSYTELDTATRAVASGLITAGVGKSSRVGLLMPNCADWVLTALAVTRIGAILVPLSTMLTPSELEAQLRTASVQFLIAVDEFRGRRYPLVVDRLPALRQVWTVEQALSLPRSPDQLADALTARVRPSDPMVILFTSGSSGPPKGVVHSHGNAVRAVASGLAARCVTADTRLYLPMPFFWVGGFGAGIVTALVAGATLVTEPIPSPRSTLALLQRERVTLFRGWPDQAEALARHAGDTDLPAFRPGSLEALLPRALRSHPGARASLFGMTESFGPYCGYPADTDMPRSAWGSCGRPFAGMDVRIVDTATGTPLPAGEVGEIQIRGPHILRGICRRGREEVFTRDGYYPTGDLGRFDDDGFLFYHGRSDDMFKVSGATVYPSEVQRALRGIDGVRAAYVVNMADDKGNRVGAVVVTDGMSVPDLRAAAREVLSPYKVPSVWALLDDEDSVPIGATGKVDNDRMRAMLAERVGR